MPDVPATDTQDATTDDAPATPPPAPEADPAGADALGDPGKKALDAMKAQRNAERDRRRELEARIAELEKPAEGAAPDADAIRAAAEREATEKANARILRAEIRAAATGKFADPADAVRFLEEKLSTFEVDANGAVDSEEIADALNTVLSTSPHLRAATASRFEDNGDGGARKASGPTQLSRSDIPGMSAEEIVAARQEGRFNNLMSGK